MKKLILTSLAVFSLISASAENSLAIAPCVVTPGNAATLVLNMNTEFEAYTVAYRMVLPTGMTFKKNGRGKFALGTTVVLDDRTEYAFAGTKSGNILTEGDHEVLKFVGAGDDYIEGFDGRVMDVHIDVASTVEPGVYPIVMEAVELYDQNIEGVVEETYTSYVVVGNPQDKSLTLQGIVPSFVNTALATEAAVKTLDLSAVTAVNGDFTYVAGRDVVAPADVTASVKFDAPKTGTYASFCAPVDVTVPCYKFKEVKDGYAIFEESATAPANVAVLVENAVKTEAQSATLKSVAGKEVSTGYYVANNGNEFHSVNGKAVIPALRGSFDIAAASNLRIAIETTTGIKVIGTADEVFGNSYDLQGRKVQNAKNGVFVVNGKKQYVK